MESEVEKGVGYQSAHVAGCKQWPRMDAPAQSTNERERKGRGVASRSTRRGAVAGLRFSNLHVIDISHASGVHFPQVHALCVTGRWRSPPLEGMLPQASPPQKGARPC